jgi:hypothetical protein
MSSMNRWNVWAAFLKPNAMKGNSNRPKGVVMAVFLCLPGGQEFGGRSSPGRSSKMWYTPKDVGRSC